MVGAKDSFRQMAPIYDRYRPTDKLVLDKITSILSESSLLGTRSMLDVGCGTGNLSIELSETLDFNLTGVDLSEEMLAHARRKHPQGTWLCQPIEDSEFEENSFDAVLMSYVIHHLDDYPLVLKRLHRCLKKPFGQLFIVTDNIQCSSPTLFPLFIPRLREIDQERFPPIDDICYHLNKIGFKTIVHKVTRERRYTTHEEIKELVRKGRARYFSTLTLIPDDELEKGLTEMEKVLREEIKTKPIVFNRVKIIIEARPAA